MKNTNAIPEDANPTGTLDQTDRKLLGALSNDASQTYNALGKSVHLSPPATHERVKRMKRDGVIKKIVAVVDGELVGRPVLSFVTVSTRSWEATRKLLALSELPDVEEIHTVTGENAMMLKLRTKDTKSLESLLGDIHAVEGVDGTTSYVVLATYLERGPSAEV